MTKAIELAFGLGIWLCVVRWSIAIAAEVWWNARYREVEQITAFDHALFLQIQETPRPWYVRVDNKLKERGL